LSVAGKYKMNLDHILGSENKCSKNEDNMTKELRSQVEEALAGQM
jgi:hypothetical protein